MDGRRLPDLGGRGEGWVLVQLVLFAAIALAGTLGPAWSGPPRVASLVLGVLLAVAGVSLAARGVLDLRENLTPFPRPIPGGHLIDTGAYGLARHPIYGGLITGAFGWGLATASPAAIVGAAVVLGFFDLKSRREEIWLAERYDDYAAYRAQTRRLLPWIY
ncbi:MAG TPA: isoprenylcysteine carboxylmethyltransferase family protein [Candidatus Limnocylindrales bacterium]